MTDDATEPSAAAAPGEAAHSGADWEEAKHIASLVGEISSLFSTCIRSLRKDAEANSRTLSRLSRVCLLRLLRSHSFLAKLYYATLTYRPEEIRTRPELTPENIIDIYTPRELANFVALMYLYQRIRRGCDPEEWKALSQQLHLYTDLSGHVGGAIPNISLARGVMVGGFRYLGMAMFLGIDKIEFVKYRRFLKQKKLLWDLPSEQKRWKCTHVQVASILIQSLGLGIRLADSYVVSLASTTPEEALDPEGLAFRVAETWTNSLAQTGAAPNITHRGEFYPLAKDLEKLISAASIINKSGSPYSWLGRGKQDISPEKTPTLKVPAMERSAAATEEEIPEGLPEEIPAEELEKLPSDESA